MCKRIAVLYPPLAHLKRSHLLAKTSSKRLDVNIIGEQYTDIRMWQSSRSCRFAAHASGRERMGKAGVPQGGPRYVSGVRLRRGLRDDFQRVRSGSGGYQDNRVSGLTAFGSPLTRVSQQTYFPLSFIIIIVIPSDPETCFSFTA